MCERLDRRLLLELILPGEEAYSGKNLAYAMESVYERGVFPFWWKLAAVSDWKGVEAVLEANDPDARVVLLGGGEGMDMFREKIAVARTCPFVSGFAVGRTVFWDASTGFLAGKLSGAGVQDMVAERFGSLVAEWRG